MASFMVENMNGVLCIYVCCTRGTMCEQDISKVTIFSTISVVLWEKHLATNFALLHNLPGMSKQS